MPTLFRTVTLPTLALALALAAPSAAGAATVRYPATTAPCNGTLQACIDGVAAGDRIEITSSARISEASLNIVKSLTLAGAPGVVPVIGTTDPAHPTLVGGSDGGDGSSNTIVFEGINFDGAGIQIDFFGGSGHRFQMTDCTVSQPIYPNSGVAVLASVLADVDIAHNVIQSNGGGVYINSQVAGGGAYRVVGNRITGIVPDQTMSGVSLDLRGTAPSTALVASNVIYGVAGCHCGSAAGIEVYTPESVSVVVTLVNNTIDDLGLEARAISLRADGAVGSTDVLMFDNIATRTYGIALQNASPNLNVVHGGNDYFDMKSGNFWGGYPALNFADYAVDPLFVNQGNRNYHLQDGSPVANVGGSWAGMAAALDADDHPRVVGVVDLGAYETGSVASADLAVSGETAPPSQAQGGEFTYSLHVTNAGPSPATDVGLAFPLPPGATLVSSSTARGTCTGTTTISCGLGLLRPADVVDVTIVATLEQAGTLQATATVTGTTQDPNGSNSFVTLSATVTASVDDGPGDLGTDPGTGGEDVIGGTDPGATSEEVQADLPGTDTVATDPGSTDTVATDPGATDTVVADPGPTAGGKSSGCAAGGTPDSPLAVAFGLLLMTLAVATLRRRAA